MKIATILSVHGDTEIVLDTIDALKTWVGDDILTIVDGASWHSWGKDVKLPTKKIEGVQHGCAQAPYRNMAYGLMHLLDNYPDADWYLYTEYDTLFVGDSFKEDLKIAEEEGVWCLGNLMRAPPIRQVKLPFIEAMLKTEIKVHKALLGCCMFYNAKFLHLLKSMNFFDSLLSWTNGFDKGFFPQFDEYDVSEHLYPTLAAHLGGKVKHMAWWNDMFGWAGNFKRYPMRFRPPLGEHDYFPEASILHPVKEMGSYCRILAKAARRRKKCSVTNQLS